MARAIGELARSAEGGPHGPAQIGHEIKRFGCASVRQEGYAVIGSRVEAAANGKPVRIEKRAERPDLGSY